MEAAEVVSWYVARHVEAPADWVALALDALVAEKGPVPPSRDGSADGAGPAR